MEGKKEEKRIANASWQNSSSFSGPAKFLLLACFARHLCVCAGRAVNWRHVGSRTESNIGENDWGRCTAKMAGRRGRERAKQSREKCCRWRMSFLFLQHPPCCYRRLHENSYYSVCLGHESERVPLSKVFIQGFLVEYSWFMLKVNTSERRWRWLCELKMQSEIIQAHLLLRYIVLWAHKEKFVGERKGKTNEHPETGSAVEQDNSCNGLVQSCSMGGWWHQVWSLSSYISWSRRNSTTILKNALQPCSIFF